MQCAFIKSDKERCKANAMNGSQYCYFHNSDVIQNRKESSSRGGQRGKHTPGTALEPVKLTEAQDVSPLLAETINLVRTGELEVNIAKCIGYLAGILLKSMETSDIETRIDKIEKLLLNLDGLDPNQKLKAI